MKRILMTILVVIGAATSAHAQQVTDITQQPGAVAPGVAVAAPQQAVKVEVPKAPEAPAPFDFSGGLTVYPIAYDDEDSYVGLTPAAGISTKFNALNGKKMTFGLNYELGYRAFITTDQHTSDESDFDNTFTLTSSIEAIDKLTLSLLGTADFAFVTNDPSGNLYSFVVEPKMTYKILPSTKISLNYHFEYWLLTEKILGPGDIDSLSDATEPGDVLGRPASSSSATGALGAFAITPAAVDPSLSHESFFYVHSVGTAIDHTFSSNISGKLSYSFARVIGNEDGRESYANAVTASITQKAWKGASFMGSYNLRGADYIYTFADDGITSRRNLRNRLTLEYTQEVTSWFSIVSHYRYQKTFSNNSATQATADNGFRHQLWIGASFSF